jgi:hypothetical protein
MNRNEYLSRLEDTRGKVPAKMRVALAGLHAGEEIYISQKAFDVLCQAGIVEGENHVGRKIICEESARSELEAIALQKHENGHTIHPSFGDSIHDQLKVAVQPLLEKAIRDAAYVPFSN